MTGSRVALLRFGAVAGLAVAVPAGARSEPHCMTRIIADVAAEEAPEQIKSKGNAVFGPVVQIKVNKSTGRMVYCAKDSYCYWSNAFEIVSPCRIKRDESRTDGRYFSYFTR